ncbi:MAG: penicillin-binding protein 2 [Lentisphaerae bacterium]|nr:penicillin-binding protein 2 [Lentisphaerota bacterium]
MPKNDNTDAAVTSPESIRVRFRFVGFILILIGLGLAGRFFYIQVIKGEDYLRAAKKIYTERQEVFGQRGEIFDRNGNLLVANAPRVHIACGPYHLKNDEERKRLAWVVSRHFPEKSYQEYYRRFAKYRYVTDKSGKQIKRRNNYQLIKRNATLDEVKLLKKSLTPVVQKNKSKKKDKRQNLLRVLSYEPAAVRTYPKGQMLANLLGYVDIEGSRMTPRNGLEKRYNADMAPDKVRNVFEKTPAGHPIIFADNKILKPADGKDLYLTILEPVQAILEEELDAVMEKWKPEAVFAAVADPRTGEVLAIAQRPTFNPADRKTYKPDVIRMRYAEDTYEPGSLAKPFSVLLALERKLVKPDDLIDCEKGRWGEKKLTDSHAYDRLTVSEVIQKSSNIGTAKIALMLGKDGVYHALRRFGFNTRSGLPIPGEVRGELRKPKVWDSLAITRIPIGYSFSTTALQLLRAYCGLANNGKVPELKLIHGFRDPETGGMQLAPPVKFLDSGTDPVQLYKLIDMMISVTGKGGTARKAAIPGFQVAGKTGTSRKNIQAVKDPVTGKILVKSHYAAGQYYASFAGFVPAHDPRLAMVITLDNPKGASYGGVVAAPAFKNTMERTLRYLNIQPTEPVLSRSRQKGR